MADGVPEGLGGLPGESPTGRVGDGARDDDRPAPTALLEERFQREDRGLGVEGVEDRLDEQQVGTAVDQPPGLFQIGIPQLVEGDIARAGVVDVRGDGCRAGRGAERSGDEARLAGCLLYTSDAADE